ncbi:tRNA (guanosine(46)-N7)-methyltransferase TrmB [Alkalilimnicola ehrlichii]|uniref:tRNA (guanine-N(7)-)-methyltransferase n=1 Tax=Alkalilimnicola ehrlichii TaxID=351052 RepID=A0A3E0WNE8_9GAMM|nr:tRNA (guanosine(46)-N7)-methyltransferase TrmB [Alkalilimnicola ehrlichii]RFA26834.1 tRNA (guanosine(46)-N7)-methyltransferase TrmB [Alkalilimnicola ehrlichii]RFA33929.1 tRNA (guanosine(46)-N7)-methyltransferase TrmB [Alkalilimnicola ehrlichii]
MTDNPTDTRRMRPIRSFVRREGRLTEGQQRALDVLYPQFGLEPDGQAFDFDAIFGRTSKTVLEIGFGNGESLATMAKNQPELDYLGIEVHRPGVGHLLMRLEEERLENVRVICGDAQEIVKHQIPDASLFGVQLFFPDPWPKKRHHKRRIVQPEWVAQMAQKIAPGGFLHLATDWENYAEHMLEVVSANPDFANQAGAGNFAPRPAHRPITKFETRGQRLGHGVWDLLLTRR